MTFAPPGGGAKAGGGGARARCVCLAQALVLPLRGGGDGERVGSQTLVRRPGEEAGVLALHDVHFGAEEELARTSEHQWDFLHGNALGCFLNGHVSGRLPKSLPPCPEISPQAKNGVFAAFLYGEFLKELAAIAQEHSIRPDILVEE